MFEIYTTLGLTYYCQFTILKETGVSSLSNCYFAGQHIDAARDGAARVPRGAAGRGAAAAPRGPPSPAHRARCTPPASGASHFLVLSAAGFLQLTSV